jgi:eukaryotic-like serine/threonine-protein kinase
MPLPPGKKLGPYEIIAFLGAGGMGEVYRARDPRIGREVALKVLPDVFASDPERLRRFEQETKAAGMLNHANILAIYDVGTYDGIPYLVAELLEGETLRDGLRGGGLPLRRTINYSIQIAEGLARAHSKGIVHRDLKPENIFICKDGGVKILDFGLAKLNEPEPSNLTLDTSPTAAAHTQPGVAIGTVGYMSPEQLRGLPVDHRSDIFSLGAIVHEMLSGKRAFQRETYADTVSAILKEDPPELTGINLRVPPQMGSLVRHCLEKNPDERFQSVRDLAFDLKAIGGDSGPTVTSESISGRHRSQVPSANRALQFFQVVALMLIAAGLGWLLARQSAPATVRQPVRLERLTDFQGLEEFPAVSPDVKSVAFSADVTGTRQIWVRLIAGGPPLQLTHDPADHISPRWFADMASILYYTPPAEGEAEGALWQVPALGGAPRRLAASVSEGDVSRDGARIAFFRLNEGRQELVVTDQNGTNARALFKGEKQQSFAEPRWSPDDRWIGFENMTQVWGYDIYVVPAAGGAPRAVTNEHNLIHGFGWEPDSSGIVFSSSRESTLVYLPKMSLWRVGLHSTAVRQLTFDEANYEYPDIGKNGDILASRRLMHFDIWKFPVAGSASENVNNGIQLTHQTAQVLTPSPSPGDKEIAFLSDSGGHGNIWVATLGSGEMRQITFEQDLNRVVGTPAWSPDGSHIAYVIDSDTATGTRADYWVVNPDGSDPRDLIPNGTWAGWSPDGRWLYYTGLVSPDHPNGTAMLKESIDGGPPVTVRTGEDFSPVVAWDGSGLYYVVPLQEVSGLTDWEIRFASPENGPSKLLARIPGIEMPDWQGLQPALSRDGKWLALPLNGPLGTNIFLLPSGGGKPKQVTDFGQLRTFIARRVSWSADDRFIYASLGVGDADIVSMKGLLP